MRTFLFTLILLSIPLISFGDGSINITLDGRWSGAAPDGTKISYEFTKDGSVSWFVEEPNFTKEFPKGLPGKYKIRVAEPYWEMDITDFADPRFKEFKFLAIIKIIDAKTFRMEGAKPGTRPKEFGKDAVDFRVEAKP